MEPSYARVRRARRCWGRRSATTSTARSRARRPRGAGLRHQDLRYTYAQFGEAVDRAAPGPSSPPASSRATGSGSGARTAPSGRWSSTRRPRPAPSWSTSTRPTGRPSSRTCSSSRAAGCWSPRPRSRRPTTCRWSRTCAATATGSSGRVHRAATGRSSSPAASRPARTSSRAPGRDPVRRPDQHPVHERHDRVPQGRHAQPPQHPQQRLLRRPRLPATPRRTGSASRCRSTTASAW